MEQDKSHGDAGGSTPSPNTASCLVDQFPEVAAECERSLMLTGPPPKFHGTPDILTRSPVGVLDDTETRSRYGAGVTR
jgi:hypothetical protein